MIATFDGPLVHAIGWALVHSLFATTAIAALAAACWRAARHERAEVRYLIGCGAMLAMLLSLLASVTAGWLDATGKPRPTTAIQISSTSGDWLGWLVAAWSVGVLANSLHVVLGWLYVRRLLRSASEQLPTELTTSLQSLATRLGVTRPVRLLESALCRVPTTIGFVRPVVLLPASVVTGLPPAQLEAVLAHELAHIRRYDFLVNLLQTAIETVLFFHPAVWFVSRRVRDEREHCCDDLAVQACIDRLTYAKALTALPPLAGRAPALAATGGSLLRRVQRLLRPDARRSTSTARCIAGMCALAMSTLPTAPLLLDRFEPAATAPIVTRSGMVRLLDGGHVLRIEPGVLVEVKDDAGTRMSDLGCMLVLPPDSLAYLDGRELAHGHALVIGEDLRIESRATRQTFVLRLLAAHSAGSTLQVQRNGDRYLFPPLELPVSRPRQ